MTPEQVERRVCEAMSDRIWQHACASYSHIKGNAASRRAAKALIQLLTAQNEVTGSRPMCVLMERSGYDYPQAQVFADDVVDACMYGDPAILDKGIVIPAFHVHIDGDQLTWDGGERRNPPRGPGVLSTFGERILLLEDDPVMQQGTARMISKVFPGVKVITTDNVDAAMSYLRLHPIAYIVSDIDVLGDKSGVDLFHHVQEQHPELVDKFLFFSGNDEAYRTHYRVLPKGDATIEDMRRAVNAPAPGARTRIAKTASPPPRPPPARRLPEPDARDIEDAVLSSLPTINESKGPSGRPMGRFGNQKVFIAAIRRVIKSDPRFANLSEKAFADALINGLRNGRFLLTRADLVGAMDPDEVAQSEIAHLNARYHFVVDESAPAFGQRPIPPPTMVPYGEPPGPRAINAGDFTRTVKEILPTIQAGRGPTGGITGRIREKVFVSAAWHAWRTEVIEPLADISLRDFKAVLLSHNRDGVLSLAGADMRAMFDEREFDESEITDRFGGLFHFIIDTRYVDGTHVPDRHTMRRGR